MNNLEAQTRYDELEMERNELIFYIDSVREQEYSDYCKNDIADKENEILGLEECMELLKKIIDLNDELKKVRAENEEMEKGLINLKR